MLRALLLALLVLAAPAVAKSPRRAVNELLSTDRAFAAASAKAAPVAGITAMFDNDVVVPMPGTDAGILVGKQAVTEDFRADPAFTDGHVTWAPVRGGISADGTQGFTFGFLTAGSGDPKKRKRKYLSYWIKRPEGWRVVTYRQIARDPGRVSMKMKPPALPAFTASPKTDPALDAANQASLAAAEQAYSDRAQIVGTGPAAREFGRPDAMSMYWGSDFHYGLKAVVADFRNDKGPALIHWNTDRSFVASSGDLGVSIGLVKDNGYEGTDPHQSTPFFTVWKRERPGAPWRYIAE